MEKKSKIEYVYTHEDEEFIYLNYMLDDVFMTKAMRAKPNSKPCVFDTTKLIKQTRECMSCTEGDTE